MQNNKTVPLFIQGVEKTGTSTLVGILNSHPNVFVLYETMINNCRISKYGNQLLDYLPEARFLFRNTNNIAYSYLELAKLLKKKLPDSDYWYIGDKLISLDPSKTQPIVPHKTIYAIRDIRSWLCKDQIVRYYRTDLDLVPPAIDYLQYLINSFRYRDALHVRLCDIVLRNQEVISSLTDFLGISYTEYANNWWEKIDSYTQENPKSYIKWFKGHSSSKVKPKELDTSIVLRSVPFWQVYLPLFDKYFNMKSFSEISEKEIDIDLSKLKAFTKHSPLPLNKGYQEIITSRLEPENSTRIKLKAWVKKMISTVAPRH